MAFKCKIFNGLKCCEPLEKKMNDFMEEDTIKTIAGVTSSDIDGKMHIVLIYEEKK